MRIQVIGHWSLVLGLLLMAVSGCKSKEQATSVVAETAAGKETMAEGPQVLASIQRTSCFGKCPIYKATFFDNGEVLFVGKNFVDNIGTYTSLISEDEIKGIIQMAKDVNYFSLEDEYPTPVVDFPKCITSVNVDGRKKSVLNGENAPRDLIGFERHLDALLKEREWTKVSDSTTY